MTIVKSVGMADGGGYLKLMRLSRIPLIHDNRISSRSRDVISCEKHLWYWLFDGRVLGVNMWQGAAENLGRNYSGSQCAIRCFLLSNFTYFTVGQHIKDYFAISKWHSPSFPKHKKISPINRHPNQTLPQPSPLQIRQNLHQKPKQLKKNGELTYIHG